MTSEVDVDVDNGLGGRLVTLVAEFGGGGNAPMLVVLRTAFAGVGIVDDNGDVDVVGALFGAVVVLSVGTAGVECVFTGLGVGKPEVVTDRDNGLPEGAAIEDAAELGRDRDSGSSGISGKGFLVFAIGSAGKGAVGGAVGGGLIFEGLCGIAEVIVVVIATDIARYARCDVSDCTLPSFALLLSVGHGQSRC